MPHSCSFAVLPYSLPNRWYPPPPRICSGCIATSCVFQFSSCLCDPLFCCCSVFVYVFLALRYYSLPVLLCASCVVYDPPAGYWTALFLVNYSSSSPPSSCLVFRLVFSGRPCVGPSAGHIIELIVPANSDLVRSGLGLFPGRMFVLFLLFFSSFSFFLFLFCFVF